MIPTEHYLLFSAALFTIGLLIAIIKQNAIMVLVGIELVLNAANINFVAFSQNDPTLSGQMFSLFVIVVAVAESAVALAIIYKVYQHYQTSDLDDLNQLNG
ncbi:MAG: NADH-quinone oxidoreductase subunit NuoK [Cyclobacteriaceae bacterium]